MKKKSSRIKLAVGSQLLILTCLLSIGAWTGVREEVTQESKSSPALVGVIKEDSLTAVLGKTREGTVIEMVFRRLPETEVVYRKWEEIMPGDRINIEYTEFFRIREGRNERGVFDRSSTLVDRKLTAVVYPPPDKKKLVSGL